jgi:predicted XRE-type DNA-binding protein
MALEASITAGNALSQRQLADRFGISRPAAAKVAREVATAGNGHASGEG